MRIGTLSQPETVSRFETEEPGLHQRLGLWWGKLPRGHTIRKPASLVGAVAKRLVGGMAAAAKSDGRTPCEAK